MTIAEELWVLDRVEGLAVDTITNVWATVTGWFDAYAWGATLALLLLLVITSACGRDDRARPCGWRAVPLGCGR
jgi:hypothetical protein